MKLLTIGNIFHSQGIHVNRFSDLDSEEKISKIVEKYSGAALVVSSVAKHINGKCSIFTSIGNTSYDEDFIDQLKFVGIDTNYINTTDKPANKLITIYDKKGSRKCYSYTKNKISIELYPLACNEVWDVVFLCCLDFDIANNLIKSKVIKAKNFVLMPSGIVYDYFDKNTLKLNGIDFLYINEGEAINVTQSESIYDAYDKISTNYHGNLIVTLGKKGALTKVGNQIKIFPTSHSPKIVHLGGAGDAFATSFTISYITEQSVVKAMNKGHEIASQIIELINPLDLLR